MATTKKKTKKAATKPAISVKTTKKKAIKKTVTKKKAVKKVVRKKTSRKIQAKNNKIKVTHEQRHKMICEAAYYISLGKTYKTVSPTEDWLQAETAINLICTVQTKLD